MQGDLCAVLRIDGPLVLKIDEAENKDAGVEALRILKGPVEVSNYDINWYSDRLRDKKYLYKVYFEGSTPENSYTPDEPFTVRFYPNPRPQDLEEGFIKLGFQAPAFDSPRYFTLRQKGDEWFIWEIYFDRGRCYACKKLQIVAKG